jgi:hypothetical protein
MENNEDKIVGYEWSDDAQVVLTGKQFRQIINFMNQYPQVLGSFLENLFGQSQKMFVDIAEELDNIVDKIEDKKPVTMQEYEQKLEEQRKKMEDSSQA